MGTSFLTPKSGDHCQIGPRSAPGHILLCQIFANVLYLSNSNPVYIAEKINRNIVKAKKTHLSYLGHENNNTIFLSSTVPKDIEDLISSMKTNTASSPKSIPNTIFKIFKNFQNP